MIEYIIYIGEMVLWNIAVWTYYPPWVLGNRFQRWWYNKNALLQSWLHWRWLTYLQKCEKEMEAEPAIESNQNI